MITGNINTFAIESIITQAYERLSFRALGCFVIHIEGLRYGVYETDASMLACSYDEVKRRLADRGSHIATLFTHQIRKKSFFRNTPPGFLLFRET